MEIAKNIDNINFFTPGQVSRVFSSAFLDEAKCRGWLLRRLHPRGAFCPYCKTAIPTPAVERFWRNEVVRCKACEKTFTAKTGTILSGKNLSFQDVFLLSFLMARGEGNHEIADTLQCTRETVRLWRRNFEAWSEG